MLAALGVLCSCKQATDTVEWQPRERRVGEGKASREGWDR